MNTLIIDDYENYIKMDIDNTIKFIGLNIPKIVLIPFGLKGGLKKGIIVEARNGVALSGAGNMCLTSTRETSVINMSNRGYKCVYLEDLMISISGNGYNPDTGKSDPAFNPCLRAGTWARCAFAGEGTWLSIQ